MSEQLNPRRRTEAAFQGGGPVGWRLGGLLDAGAVARLAEVAFEPEYREAWTTGQISGLLVSSDAWLELGEIDGALISFALCRQAADEVELLLCATSPDLRRQGLGMELMARVSEQCRLRGVRKLFLEVRSSNLSALALYRKAGFREDGRRPGYYHTVSGDRIDALTLSCEP